MKTKVHSARVTVHVRKQEREEVTDSLGTHTTLRSVPDGTKTATVELWIDLANLITDLGARAIWNKAKKASLASGDIEVVVVGQIERAP